MPPTIRILNRECDWLAADTVKKTDLESYCLNKILTISNFLIINRFKTAELKLFSLGYFYDGDMITN